jgi:gluconokinase
MTTGGPGWEQLLRAGKDGVVACSALKRRYRDILIGDRPDVRLVNLEGEQELIARRKALRYGHFMPASLLDSQFTDLEELGEEENPIVVSIESQPYEIVHELVTKLRAATNRGGNGGVLRQFE